MSETIYCPVRTYPATRDSPAEWCLNEVPDYGELCGEHDAQAWADDNHEKDD